MSNVLPAIGRGYKMPVGPNGQTRTVAAAMESVSQSPLIQQQFLNEQNFPDVPSWAISMMQETRALHIEQLTLMQVLMLRHVVTKDEIDRTRSDIIAATDTLLKNAMEQLSRRNQLKHQSADVDNGAPVEIEGTK